MHETIIDFVISLSYRSFLNAFSQDIAFARKMVDTLTSPYFWGRGYTNDGMKKAAEFLTFKPI